MAAILFSLALFLSAALLFWVQLMTSKLLLPLLGGGASVWNTCLMFFQGMLLLGYLYAHATERWLRRPYALFLHPLFLLCAGFALPVSLHGLSPSPGDNPVLWLLQALMLMIGAPFLALAGNAPLLQAWYARAGQKKSGDPYFLYAASNAGSLIALTLYPTLIEPRWHLSQQNHFWTYGYCLLAGLVCLCAVISRKQSRSKSPSPWRGVTVDALREHADSSQTLLADPPPNLRGEGNEINMRTRLFWIALAFVPSSLLLGVTAHVTTDIAAVPLFWVIPLILYLLSFVLAFQQSFRLPQESVATGQAFLVAMLAVAFFTKHIDDVLSLLVLHLGAFFLTALLCHQRLAASRPPARHLTEFYLYLSLGGALGGFFNALVAPALFNAIIEYPLMLIAACLLRPGTWPALKERLPSLGDIALPLCVFVLLVIPNHHAVMPLGILVLSVFFLFHRPMRFVALCAALLLVGYLLAHAHRLSALQPQAQVLYDAVKAAVENPTPLHLLKARYAYALVMLLALAVFCFQKRPVRFALGIAALIGASLLVPDEYHVLVRARNFYGVLKVVADTSSHVLMNGTTIHGVQLQDPNRRLEPTLYYNREGPLGEFFRAAGGTGMTRHVALVGLGVGAVACYEKPGEDWTYFEINPADIALAQNPDYFTFLRDCSARPTVEQGDARLSLAQKPDASYGLIILDAFTSDSIPLHLMTREAMQLYLQKLAPDGVLLFHISNRNLELGPVVGSIADTLDLQARRWRDEDPGLAGLAFAKSDWVLITRNLDNVKTIRDDGRWKPLFFEGDDYVWTDDYSNLYGALIF